MSDAASRPFGKYERFGAYHWREIEPFPTRHNAVLTARYRVLLDAMDANAIRVLDIGCGDGTLTFRLAGRSERVWGIDDSMLPLQLARAEFARRPRHRAPVVMNADARRLPFADEAFDCVVLADVIEHIDAPGPVMSEAHRVLRKGGQILVTTPRRQDSAPAQYHCHEYTGAELAELLRERFDAVQVRVFRPLRVSRLYDRRVFGRKLFRIFINCCAIAGWNPLAASGALSDESRHTDLCASGRKA
ncbi:MAG TPA: class I SAM-dependent methyltransferase [Vicinamibacterales bacterium]|nr:class I SAM-dependent methyltransferase [Vicinamibacterales bacterium]